MIHFGTTALNHLVAIDRLAAGESLEQLEPYFLVSGQLIEVKLGDTVVLPCRVANLGEENNGGTTNHICSNRQSDVLRSGRRRTLAIRKFQPYVCQFANPPHIREIDGRDFVGKETIKLCGGAPGSVSPAWYGGASPKFEAGAGNKGRNTISPMRTSPMNLFPDPGPQK